nr:hypothetical protein [Candidatus Levybacteria bacterium]
MKKSKKLKKKSFQPSLKFYLLGVLVFFFAFTLTFSNLIKINGSQRSPRPVVVKNHVPVCPGSVSPGSARCSARAVSDTKGSPLVTTSPTGYGPLEFHGAYNLPTTATSGMPIIAIVDAYDNPNALSDLNTYSSTFGIPSLPACSGSIASSSVPCFAKIDQNGGTTYPKVDSGWALESSLDVQVAHAICQNCKILLVEATSNSILDLGKAVNQAVSQGAVVVSNSYGASEFSSETSYDAYYNHPAVAVLASAGDAGFGTGYPAASKYVVSVGGTTLYLNTDNTYNNETVWSGTSSGCSAYEGKPSWQTDSGCANRTLNDVSADADPSTGASVYDSTPYNGQSGWFQVGGTSLSSPLIAAVFALSGNYQVSTLYSNASYLHDITSGSNGTCSSYLCVAGVGFDGPTGLGTPNGLTAFAGGVLTPTPTSGLTATPTPTTAPLPTVLITNPLNNSTVARRSTVTIATSTTNTVKVNFTVNGSLVCSTTVAPFSCNWNIPARPNATYKITATAYNSANNTASNSVTVTSK